jgi:hypothetical protein
MIYRNVLRVNRACCPTKEGTTMQLEINRGALALARDALVGIRDGQGTRILCQAGSLWITQEGDVRDVVIGAGEGFTVRTPGLTLVTALRDSKVAVQRAAESALAAHGIAGAAAGCAA